MELLYGYKTLNSTIERFSKSPIKQTTIAIIRFSSIPGGVKFEFASQVSTRNKINAFRKLNINVVEDILAYDISLDDFSKIIDRYNQDTSINGIIIQHPIRQELKPILKLIAYKKDLDGLSKTSKFQICAVAEAAFRLLMELDFKGKQILIVGGKGFVGSDVASILILNRIAYTSVDIDDELEEEIRNSDIIISCVGKANLIPHYILKPHQIGIDIGFNIDDDLNLVGDFSKESYSILNKITPVPGGMGPLNISVLIERFFFLNKLS